MKTQLTRALKDFAYMIVEVYDMYLDARKTIILSVEEIAVTGPTSPREVVCNTDLMSEEESSEEDSSSGVSEG